MTRLLLIALLVGACSGTVAPAAATQSPDPTPTATPDIPYEPDTSNLGVITFGTAIDEDTLLIAKPVSRFKRTTKKIAWSAQLSETANASSLTFVVASQSASGAERGILKTEQDISDPSFSLLGNAVDLASLLDNKAGTYVMRYLREGTVLAEGTFTLVK